MLVSQVGIPDDGGREEIRKRRRWLLDGVPSMVPDRINPALFALDAAGPRGGPIWANINVPCRARHSPVLAGGRAPKSAGWPFWATKFFSWHPRMRMFIALDAKTREAFVWGLSRPWSTARVTASRSRRLAIKNLVIIGNVGRGNMGIRGFIGTRTMPGTGERKWRFYTVPGPGEPGHETWGRATRGKSEGRAGVDYGDLRSPATNTTFWDAPAILRLRIAAKGAGGRQSLQ